jgi:hypothetical protein
MGFLPIDREQADPARAGTLEPVETAVDLYDPLGGETRTLEMTVHVGGEHEGAMFHHPGPSLEGLDRSSEAAYYGRG